MIQSRVVKTNMVGVLGMGLFDLGELWNLSFLLAEIVGKGFRILHDFHNLEFFIEVLDPLCALNLYAEADAID
jgi:hypothetical protein